MNRKFSVSQFRIFTALFSIFLFNLSAFGAKHANIFRHGSDAEFEVVPNVSVEIQTSDGKLTRHNRRGRKIFPASAERIAFGQNFRQKHRTANANFRGCTDALEDVQIKITYIVPPVNENVTIQADALSPEIEQRNDTVYKNNLFGRDDQLIFTLNAGINAGQHEGGGKSLEIRRFGFNLDHGGVNGGVENSG